ncbi:hypothetical protein KUV22_04725 [Microbulbifer agarilyticus]|uniref:hypothetical protein n=1 Tax=Microbulbifer agarilyticus TaxID=260552 RepID=UPI001C9580E1|nr:hypothetical protein [Microbulbifer agarilyticus]MBY6189716.1 hypothetical protein [Microbulbifer agarilyticus]
MGKLLVKPLAEVVVGGAARDSSSLVHFALNALHCLSSRFNQLTTLELESQTGGSLDSAIASEAEPNQITIDHAPIFITMKKTCKGFLLQNLIQKQIQPAAE